MQGGEQGRLLFLPTCWRCLPSAPPHPPPGPPATRAAVPLRAPSTPCRGIGRPWKPLPGCLLTTRSCPLSCARSPAHPGPRPEHALRPGGTDILQPAGGPPQRLPLPRPAAAPCVPGGHSLSSLLGGVKKLFVKKSEHPKSEQYFDGALLQVGRWSFNGQFWFPVENALTLLWGVWAEDTQEPAGS